MRFAKNPDLMLLILRGFSELFSTFDKRPTFYNPILVAPKEAKALSAVSCSQLNCFGSLNFNNNPSSPGYLASVSSSFSHQILFAHAFIILIADVSAVGEPVGCTAELPHLRPDGLGCSARPRFLSIFCCAQFSA